MMVRLLTVLCLSLAAGSARAAVPLPVSAAHAMVVTDQHLATAVGVDILRDGGNAVDAAVAVAYALAVVNPCCGNIGGGGFMTIHLADGRERVIDFREKAPATARADMFLGADGGLASGASTVGWRAVAVPGTVLGLETARERYGRLSRAAVMAPAIRLARDGFVLGSADADIFARSMAWLKLTPDTEAWFRKADGTALGAGDRLRQPQLAALLDAISAHGPDAFYKGAVPRAIEAASSAGGGLLTAGDFAGYSVADTAPLVCSYRGNRLVLAPPPSSGGITLCEILNILEGYDLKAMGFHSAAATHAMVEAMRHAFLDRNTLLGDPDFVKNPVERLLSKDYAGTIRAAIPADRAARPDEVAAGTAPHERPETTHFSVLDKEGGAVALTFTLNGYFGAGVMAPGFGFFLNNEMDDFAVKPGAANLSRLVQGTANRIEPGKRPLSSMAPTIVTGPDGKVLFVLGSPGGSRIITAVAEALVNLIDFGMGPVEAVDAPRFHFQGEPDRIFAEPYAFSADTLARLKSMGYTVEEQRPWSAVELIDRPAADRGLKGGDSGHDAAASGALSAGAIYGANDDRRPAGAALGN